MARVDLLVKAGIQVLRPVYYAYWVFHDPYKSRKPIGKHLVSGDCFVWKEYAKDPTTGLPLKKITWKRRCLGTCRSRYE